jgi:signal transduction histidine kinase
MSTDLAPVVDRWCGLNTDIEDRTRAEALLAGEKKLLEMVATGCSLPIVLHALCELFERITSECTCSVILVDATGTYLQQGASPSLDPEFTKSIDGRVVSVENGPCAMAASLNEQVGSADVSTETRWSSYGWCELALSFGVRACWSTPIRSSTGKVVGTFGLHYHYPATPSPLHQSLIEQFTHLASIAIVRAREEDALKRSEAFLVEAQRLSLTGSFAWRVASDLVAYSEQTYRIYEFDPAVRVTLDLIATRIHPDDLPLLQEMIRRSREDGSDLDYEYRLLMPDGTVKHLHLVAHGARDQHGELEYIGAIQDISQRRRSEHALEKVRSGLARVSRVTSLGALTASIAHEVNQPLAGIVTNAGACVRMLSAEPPKVGAAQETVRRMLRDANRASDVITRLRALFAGTPISTEPMDLSEAAREVIALSLGELQRNRVILQTDLCASLPLVRADRVQIQQVILNLLLNASESMCGIEDRPRELLVRTARETGERVLLTVQDSGLGLDPEVAELVFQPFYTTKENGMGIGLSVSRSIMERHHGQIWAAPNRGAGASFSFSLPHAAAPMNAP